MKDVAEAHSSDGDAAAAATYENDRVGGGSNRVVHTTGDIFERRTLVESAANVKSYLARRRERQERWARNHSLQTRHHGVASQSTHTTPQSPDDRGQTRSNNVSRGDEFDKEHSVAVKPQQKSFRVSNQRRRALLRVSASARAFDERKKTHPSTTPTPKTYATESKDVGSGYHAESHKEDEHENDLIYESSTANSRESDTRWSGSGSAAESTKWHHWQTSSIQSTELEKKHSSSSPSPKTHEAEPDNTQLSEDKIEEAPFDESCDAPSGESISSSATKLKPWREWHSSASQPTVQERKQSIPAPISSTYATESQNAQKSYQPAQLKEGDSGKGVTHESPAAYSREKGVKRSEGVRDQKSATWHHLQTSSSQPDEPKKSQSFSNSIPNTYAIGSDNTQRSYHPVSPKLGENENGVSNESSTSEEFGIKERGANGAAKSTMWRHWKSSSNKSPERKKKQSFSTPIARTYATESKTNKSIYSTTSPKGGDNEQDVLHKAAVINSGGSGIREIIDSIAAKSTMWQHWQSSPNQSIFTDNNEERKRRFEEAYKAIMDATNANFENDEVSVSTKWLEAGGKRWTRDPNLPPAVSIDGRLYDDLQRGPTISSKPTVYRMNYGSNIELLDRAATWLAHLPTPISGINIQQPYTIERNNSIAEAILGHGIERSTTPPREPLQHSYREKQSGFESMIQGVGDLELTQGFQTTAHSPSPLKHQTMQERIKCKDNETLPFERVQWKVGKKPNLDGHSTEDNATEQKDRSDSKPTSVDRPAAVGISTLRKLFSGVQSESKNPDPPSNSVSGGKAFIRDRSATNKLELSVDPPSKHHMKPQSLSHFHDPRHGLQNETRQLDPIEDSSSSNHERMKELHQAYEPNLTRGNDDTDQYRRSLPKRNDQDTTTMDNEMDAYERFVNKNGLKNNDTTIVATNSDGKDLSELDLLEIDASKSKSPSSLKDGNGEDKVLAKPNLRGQKNFDEIIGDDINVTNLVKESLLTRQPSIIDTDGAESEIDVEYKIQSMLMSPSLITKRYQQALNAIEGRKWKQLSYLTNANPWLMEMKNVINDQFLVHSLSLFGGGPDGGIEDSPENVPLPQQLAQNIIDYEPNVVHKIDTEGNLPLHMAAASGNIIMIEELGRRFSGAASVQNHNGLLPLHLAIMSCAFSPTGIQSVELVLMMFPGAVGVKDLEGNTPLHTAAGMLRGEVGSNVINQLVDSCYALMMEKRFFFDKSTSSAKKSIPIADGVDTEQDELDTTPDFYLLKNNQGENPLTRAVKSLAGSQVVEALLNGGCGQLAALDTNSALQNAFHLALDRKFHDAAVVLSILKSTPSIATIRDGNGMLPIQIACSNSLQHEILLAIAIIDLPIDLGSKEGAILRNGFGASWWYLLCESNDIYVSVVKDILSLCSRPQKIALCLTNVGNRHDGKTAVTCATPLCKHALRRSLLFLGRFEIAGGEKKSHVSIRHLLKFDAIDYGTEDDPYQDEKKVGLVCYTDASVYRKDIEHLHRCSLDTELFEELSHFIVSQAEADVISDIHILGCAAVDRPLMSLANVVAGMPNSRYRSDPKVLGRYFGKCRSILRLVAKALTELHREKIIHGLVDLYHIGKIGEKWKLTGLHGSVVCGEQFATFRLGLHSPPEAFVLAHGKLSHELNLVSLAPLLKAEATVDVWAFGKLMYEVLVGESLFKIFLEVDEVIYASELILEWSNEHLQEVSNKLLEERIGLTGVDLILGCLCPKKSARTKSMLEILNHPFWRDEKAFILR